MSRCAMKGDYNVGCGGPFDSSSLFLYLNSFFNSESLLVDELVGGSHAIVIGFDEADKVKIVKCWNPSVSLPDWIEFMLFNYCSSSPPREQRF